MRHEVKGEASPLTVLGSKAESRKRREIRLHGFSRFVSLRYHLSSAFSIVGRVEIVDENVDVDVGTVPDARLEEHRFEQR